MAAIAFSTRRNHLTTETLLRGVLGLMVAVGCISYIEPSPYDMFFPFLIIVLLISGVTITREIFCLYLIIFVIISFEVTSLLFHIEDRVGDNGVTPALYTAITAYLYPTSIVFGLVFSKRTSGRLRIALNAYAFSCVIAGLWGILSYLDVGGLGDREPSLGRIAGPFKDPNVFGTYCVLGTLYLIQCVIIGSSRLRIVNIIASLLSLCGVLLSFSRGSTGAMIFSFLYLIMSTYMTADGRAMRRKVQMTVIGGLLFFLFAGIFVAADRNLLETISTRAHLIQDYDGGATGRFGQQMRSIPMLLERPLGFGPYRFPFYFGLQPHNSYINAFAEAGWVGGIAFLFLAFLTCGLAVRQSFERSPFMRHAQVIAPAVLSYFLQGAQIDIDHWRFLFLTIGAVWGMEAARSQFVATRLRGLADKAGSGFQDPPALSSFRSDGKSTQFL